MRSKHFNNNVYDMQAYVSKTFGLVSILVVSKKGSVQLHNYLHKFY